MTIEEEIAHLESQADRYQWIGMVTNAKECRQVAEWLEELVELRMRLRND